MRRSVGRFRFGRRSFGFRRIRRRGGFTDTRIEITSEQLSPKAILVRNRGIVLSLALAIGAFGAAAIAFLYSKSTGGFGSKVQVDKSLKDVLAYTSEKKEPYYVPEARSYLVPYPTADVPKAKQVPQYEKLIPNMEQGIVAIYQKCVHLGCKVPWCASSQWFECPCHGSNFNPKGDVIAGPAPVPLLRAKIELAATGDLIIDKAKFFTDIVVQQEHQIATAAKHPLTPPADPASSTTARLCQGRPREDGRH